MLLNWGTPLFFFFLPLPPGTPREPTQPSIPPRHNVIPPLIAIVVTSRIVFRRGRGPFHWGAQKNSRALAAASNRLRPIVAFEYSSPCQRKLTQQVRCMQTFLHQSEAIVSWNSGTGKSTSAEF